MTLRGLVFGNSHAASLRLAWRTHQAQWPEITLAFAAAAGDGMDAFSVQDGQLSSPQRAVRENLMMLNGCDAFDLRDYGFFVICGGTPSMFHAVHLYRAAAIPTFAATGGRGRVLMSRAGFQAALAGVMQNLMGYRLAVKLAVMGKPCFVAGHPRLSIAAKADPKTYPGFLRVVQNGDGTRLSGLFDAAATDAYAGVATYVPQPAQTIADDIFTAEVFRRGAVRLTQTDDVAQPLQDYLHANGDYGALLIDRVCMALKQEMAAPPVT
jgi:hypothetical protein